MERRSENALLVQTLYIRTFDKLESFTTKCHARLWRLAVNNALRQTQPVFNIFEFLYIEY